MSLFFLIHPPALMHLNAVCMVCGRLLSRCGRADPDDSYLRRELCCEVNFAHFTANSVSPRGRSFPHFVNKVLSISRSTMSVEPTRGTVLIAKDGRLCVLRDSVDDGLVFVQPIPGRGFQPLVDYNGVNRRTLVSNQSYDAYGLELLEGNVEMI